MDISIENLQGSAAALTRMEPHETHEAPLWLHQGNNCDRWRQTDVFVKPGTPEDYSGPVFVVDQMKPPRTPTTKRRAFSCARRAEIRLKTESSTIATD